MVLKKIKFYKKIGTEKIVEISERVNFSSQDSSRQHIKIVANI